MTRVLQEFLDAIGASELEHSSMNESRHLFAVRHHLDRIEQVWHLLDGEVVSVTLTGRAQTKRTSLWVHDIPADLTEGAHEFQRRVADAVEVVVAGQPMSTPQLLDLLRTGSVTWQQESFDF